MVKKRVISRMLGDQRVGYFDDQEALSSDLTIKEAIDGGYVTGKVTVITQMVEAVFNAMKDGIQKDGNGRKIDDYVTIQAYLKTFLADPTDNVTKENAKVVLRARMLKNFKVDPFGWSFVFVDGMVNFLLEVITTGEETDVIHLGEDVLINGRGLELVDGDTVSWSVPEDGAVVFRHGLRRRQSARRRDDQRHAQGRLPCGRPGQRTPGRHPRLQVGGGLSELRS